MKPKILIVRGGAIGDFVLTLPAIQLVRENFPEAHLEILGYKHIAALAENRFYAQAVRSIEYGALSGFFVPNGKLDPDLTAYFSGFQQIISYLFDPDRFFETNVLKCGVKHFLHASPRIDDSAHAAQQLARPLERLALFLENRSATLYPSPEDRVAAAEFLPDTGSPVIAIHAGSGSETKNWPLQSWLALGDWLWTLEPSPRLLLVGGEADRQRMRALKAAWQGHPIVTAEDLPLQTLAAVLERASLFLGHDSGISHIAAAVGTRCILLFGPTDPDIWAPANPNVTVVLAPGGVLERLGVEPVRQKVLEAFCSVLESD